MRNLFLGRATREELIKDRSGACDLGIVKGSLEPYRQGRPRWFGVDGPPPGVLSRFAAGRATKEAENRKKEPVAALDSRQPFMNRASNLFARGTAVSIITTTTPTLRWGQAGSR